ncbi:MAG: prolyl oligopeptidase family serine peptidase [bacterium]
MKNQTLVLFTLLLFTVSTGVFAQEQQRAADPIQVIQSQFESLNHRLDRLEKMVDDVLWNHNISDVAWMDKVILVGPPPARVKNQTAMGAKNPVRIYAYIFIPKQIDRSKKYPLLLLPHGGVHGNFGTYHTHIIRECMAQGYIVAAPEYRGSNGYGRDMYEQIDYGGLENEDNNVVRDYAVDTYNFVDSDRVGIFGWSHGGMITLFELFNHPEDYKVGFAGVPVSDLVQRMGYATDEYRKLMSAPYHIGKTAREDVNEYRKRSPVNHVEKLKTPLLIHSNTNDDDVYVLEVEHLVEALKAAGKKFEYEIFKEMPGGHSFDRIDIQSSREIRLKIYTFLAEYLKPPFPLKSVDALIKAGYR